MSIGFEMKSNRVWKSIANFHFFLVFGGDFSCLHSFLHVSPSWQASMMFESLSAPTSSIGMQFVYLLNNFT